MKVRETTYEQHKCDMNTFVIILHELHSLAQFVSFSAFILLFSCSLFLSVCVCVTNLFITWGVIFRVLCAHNFTLHRCYNATQGYGFWCVVFSLFFACNSEPIALMEYVQRCIQFYIHFVSADTVSIWSHYIVTETIPWRNLRLMRPTHHRTLH